ncbi:MAG TPA: hypothetical protein VNS32_10890, partial [Flavisolibacter sp.]|nr:hypothetical protein [Flavisolibacter sp.]
MKKIRSLLFAVLFLLPCLFSIAQDTPAQPFQWNISSKKLSGHQYEIIFSTPGNKDWELYAPAQVLNDVPVSEVQFTDSSIQPAKKFT